jgi:hypothetical protein
MLRLFSFDGRSRFQIAPVGGRPGHSSAVTATR